MVPKILLYMWLRGKGRFYTEKFIWDAFYSEKLSCNSLSFFIVDKHVILQNQNCSNSVPSDFQNMSLNEHDLVNSCKIFEYFMLKLTLWIMQLYWAHHRLISQHTVLLLKILRVTLNSLNGCLRFLLHNSRQVSRAQLLKASLAISNSQVVLLNKCE